MNCYWAAIIGLSLLSNCTNDSVDNERHVIIKGQEIPLLRLDLAPDSATTVGWSALFENVEIIPLETQPECLIRYPRTIFTDHSMIVSTQVGMGDPCKVYEFDFDGKFIREIGGTGKGPGEHTGYSLEDATYHPIERLIKVQFNGILSHVQYFDTDGQLVEDFKCPVELVQNIDRIDENLYVVAGALAGRPDYQRDSASLFWFNEAGEIIKTLERTVYPPKNSSGYTPWAGGTALFKFENNWRFHNPGNDTLYQIDGLELTTKAVFKHGEDYVALNKIITPEAWVGSYMSELLSERSNYWILEKMVITMQKMQEWRPGQWGGEFGADYFNLFVDKSNGSVHNLKFTDDLLGIVPDSMSSDDIQFDPLGQSFRMYQAVDVVEWIDDAIEKGSIPSGRVKQVMALRKKINENSNPILFLFKERKRYKL